jgi:hypothetical protein
MAPPRSQFGAEDVPVTASCPAFQKVDKMLVAPFLQRGCNNAFNDPDQTAQIDERGKQSLILGVTPSGRTHMAINDTQTAIPPGFYCIPLCTVFSVDRNRDARAELADLRGTKRESMDFSTLHDIEAIGFDFSPGCCHALDGIYFFRCHDFNQPRSDRLIPWQAQHKSVQNPEFLEYRYFAFPAFSLSGVRFDDAV